jgi:hypothetical protein
MTAVLVARQVGTAAAFVPVAAALPGARLLLYPLAAREHADVPHTAADDASILAQLERIGSISMLVTGSSEKSAEDAAQWSWARSRRIPSLAYVDQGVNLELRFARGWPDAVATIGEKEAAQLRALAPDGVVVHVTGSPAVEAFAREVQRYRTNGTAAEPGRVLFATEPITGMAADEYRRINGFIDEDAYALVKRAVAQLGAKLLVRLHPRDRAERWPDAELDRNARGAESVARAQVVCGTRSMFLVEAAAAGVPVVSLQPGRRTPSPLDEIPIAEDDDQALAALRRALNGTTVKNERHRGACERFIGLLR